jgi:hypothetical protein
MVVKLGVKASEPQLRKTFDTIDEDGGGSLGFEEFQNWLAEGSSGDDETFVGLAAGLLTEVQRSKDALLIQAASKFNLDRVKHWIGEGADKNAKDSVESAILHCTEDTPCNEKKLSFDAIIPCTHTEIGGRHCTLQCLH